MQLLMSFANSFLMLLNEMAIYILVGLFFSGILKQLLPSNFVSKHLGKGNISSVVKATLLGIPLPVCSCSVIPLSQGLKKEGASKGAVQSFLISTPITGVDSILATYSFFGLFFTLFRLISSVIISIIVGILQNLFENKNEGKSDSIINNTCCSTNTKKEKFSLKNAFIYAYMTLFKDMAKPLFIGLLLGALFTSFMPKEYSNILFENQVLTYFVILLFSIPLYVCATASLPLAAAFMLKGMSAGAAFIFLTAGPATSIITISVVYKMLGKRSLFIYLSCMMILSLIFGFSFDFFFSDLKVLSFVNIHEHTSFISQVSSMVLLLLMIYHLIKLKINQSSKKKINSFALKQNSAEQKMDFNKITFKSKP